MLTINVVCKDGSESLLLLPSSTRIGDIVHLTRGKNIVGFEIVGYSE